MSIKVTDLGTSKLEADPELMERNLLKKGGELLKEFEL